MKNIAMLALTLVFAASVSAQTDKNKKPAEKGKSAVANVKVASPLDLANGGDKFKGTAAINLRV